MHYEHLVHLILPENFSKLHFQAIKAIRKSISKFIKIFNFTHCNSY